MAGACEFPKNPVYINNGSEIKDNDSVDNIIINLIVLIDMCFLLTFNYNKSNVCRRVESMLATWGRHMYSLYITCYDVCYHDDVDDVIRMHAAAIVCYDRETSV